MKRVIVVGKKITLTDAMRVTGGSGVLQSITVIDVSATKPALELLIFNADPTAATLTDQAAVALSTDISKVIHTNLHLRLHHRCQCIHCRYNS